MSGFAGWGRICQLFSCLVDTVVCLVVTVVCLVATVVCLAVTVVCLVVTAVCLLRVPMFVVVLLCCKLFVS